MDDIVVIRVLEEEEDELPPDTVALPALEDMKPEEAFVI